MGSAQTFDKLTANELSRYLSAGKHQRSLGLIDPQLELADWKLLAESQLLDLSLMFRKTPDNLREILEQFSAMYVHIHVQLLDRKMSEEIQGQIENGSKGRISFSQRIEISGQ